MARIFFGVNVSVSPSLFLVDFCWGSLWSTIRAPHIPRKDAVALFSDRKNHISSFPLLFKSSSIILFSKILSRPLKTLILSYFLATMLRLYTSKCSNAIPVPFATQSKASSAMFAFTPVDLKTNSPIFLKSAPPPVIRIP